MADVAEGEEGATTSPTGDEVPKEEEGGSAPPRHSSVLEPEVGSLSGAAQATAFFARPAAPAPTEPAQPKDGGGRKPLLSEDCCTCYACNISVPHKEMMGQHMMTDSHVHNVAVFYGLKPP